MKTLQEIKDEVAYCHDYKDWAEVDGDFVRNDYFMIDEVAKRYAEEAIKVAAGKVPWVNRINILNIIKELK